MAPPTPVNSEFGIRNSEFPTHPPQYMCVLAQRSGGPRRTEVPFLTLSEQATFESAESHGQTMSRVAPLGKRVQIRPTSQSPNCSRRGRQRGPSLDSNEAGTVAAAGISPRGSARNQQQRHSLVGGRIQHLASSIGSIGHGDGDGHGDGRTHERPLRNDCFDRPPHP